MAAIAEVYENRPVASMAKLALWEDDFGLYGLSDPIGGDVMIPSSLDVFLHLFKHLAGILSFPRQFSAFRSDPGEARVVAFPGGFA